MPMKPKTYSRDGKTPEQRRGSRSARGYDWEWYKRGGIRDQILLRDLYTCQKCGTITIPGSKGPRAPHVDHIDANRMNRAWSNLRCLCASCNSSKKNRAESI